MLACGKERARQRNKMEQPPEVGDFLPSRSHLSEFEQEQDTSQTSQLEDPQTTPEAAETPAPNMLPVDVK